MAGRQTGGGYPKGDGSGMDFVCGEIGCGGEYGGALRWNVETELDVVVVAQRGRVIAGREKCGEELGGQLDVA